MTWTAYTSLLVSPQHGAMLVEDSAIAPALVQQRGYQSLPQPEDLIDRGFAKTQAKLAPALGMPLWDVHGKRCGWQIRPDQPRQMRDGRIDKYELPTGDRLILDVHPSVQPRIGDPHEPLWITEGVRKGDALASQGVCAIALPGGVWGFRGTNAFGGKVILPDWDYVALNDRLVIVAFDSDLATKKGVQAALQALWILLRHKRARPVRLEWPEAFTREKWGVDDFFARGHTLDELRAMIPPLGPLPEVPPRRTTFSVNGHTHAPSHGDPPREVRAEAGHTYSGTGKEFFDLPVNGKREVFMAKLLADALMERQKYRFTDPVLWVYKEGVYVRDEGQINSDCLTLLGPEWTSRRRNEATPMCRTPSGSTPGTTNPHAPSTCAMACTTSKRARSARTRPGTSPSCNCPWPTTPTPPVPPS